MMLITYNMFKEKVIKNTEYIVANLIPCGTSVILVGDSKSGKSSIVLQLVYAALSNNSFLDIEKYNIDYVIFFSNDSNEASLMKKIEKIGFDEGVVNRLFFNFEKVITISEYEQCLAGLYVRRESNILIVVDVLAGIQIQPNGKSQIDLNNYQDVHLLIDSVEKTTFAIFPNASILYLHHLNKRGSCLGSVAIKSRVSCYMTLSVSCTLDRVCGKLDIQSNDGFSRVIPLVRDDQAYRWLIDEAGIYEENFNMDTNIIRINDALVNEKSHQIEGDVNYIIARCRLTITPRRFGNWVEENKRILSENNISVTKRKSNTTLYMLSLIDDRG